MLDFRHFLEKAYQADPAKDKEGNPLPLTYPEKLSDEALQPYFKHHAHTVWRWLFCHPNPWMHPAAEYLAEAANCAHITDAHKETIAYLWLAVSDKQVKLEAGWTVEKMQAYFIRSIAYLGRAHNWYERNERGEEIRELSSDDLQRDRPSCVSGVMQRLIDGSMMGHPYFINPSARELNATLFSEKCWQEFFNPIYTQGWEAQSAGTLKTIESALKFVLEMGSLTEPHKKSLTLPICDTAREDFMRICEAWWGKKRLAEESCIWQGERFDNYHALFAHWCTAPEPIMSFWERLNAVLKGHLERLHEMINLPSTSTGIYHIRKRRLSSEEENHSDENSENDELNFQRAKRKR